MASLKELDAVYMQVAQSCATLSKAVRLKVGAAIVLPSGVILTGFNGTPTGLDNACEIVVDSELVTKPSVIHAELNCIMKAAREGVSVLGATAYITHSPCEACAAMLVQAGIKRVVYSEDYRSKAGLHLLYSADVMLEQLQG